MWDSPSGHEKSLDDFSLFFRLLERRFGGKGEMELRTLTQLAFHPEPSAVLLYDRLTDRKTETGTALLPRIRSIDLSETLKNLGNFVFRNP